MNLNWTIHRRPGLHSAAYESQRLVLAQLFNGFIGKWSSHYPQAQPREGYANDNNRTFSYVVKTFPSADTFSLVGLPAELCHLTQVLEKFRGSLTGWYLSGYGYR